MSECSGENRHKLQPSLRQQNEAPENFIKYPHDNNDDEVDDNDNRKEK